MIELIVMDIDGVVTDGTITVNSEGEEQKKLSLKDVDAIFELHRRGFKLAAITGEDTEIVKYFEKRFPWDFFYRGSKTKTDAMILIENETGISRENICYIGDGKYDVEPLKHAGLGICPADAINKAKTVADVVLHNPGGKGCVWEMISVLEKYNDDGSGEKFLFDRLQAHAAVIKKMASDVELMEDAIKIGDDIIETFQNGGGIYFCGNGGSAADAQHLATEFVSRFFKERPGLNAEALTVNSSILTAIGNDYSYERIFVRQLEAKAKPGDILFGITTSGKSKNVIEALRYAQEHGIKTVLLMGNFDTHKITLSTNYTVKVPSKVTPRIQEAHIFIGHVIAEYVEHKMFQDM